MEIRFGDIVLRDMRASDIADDIRWNTLQTEWALWDAPWEMEEELRCFDPEAYRSEQLERLKQAPQGFRWSLDLDTADGIHIGSVSAYLIDEAWEWIRMADVKSGQTVFHTLGIEINEPEFWSRGLGTQALAAYIQYHLQSGVQEICLQTWSGNARMVRSAQKLGFSVCCRKRGIRFVRGEVYDALTFRLDLEAFACWTQKNLDKSLLVC